MKTLDTSKNETPREEPGRFKLVYGCTPVIGPGFRKLEEAMAFNHANHRDGLGIAEFNSAGERVRFISREEQVASGVTK